MKTTSALQGAAPGRAASPALFLEDFSLVLGGPLYQMYRRSHLLHPPVELVERRLLAMVLLTWLPLLLLSVMAGEALGGVTVSFLSDVDAHVRLLIALPLLIAAEPLVHRRLRATVRQFVDHNIVTAQQRPRFEAMIADTIRWRNSVAVEIALLAASTCLGYWTWRQEVSLHVSTWYQAAPADTGVRELTSAGAWYAFVSLNLLRFVMLRWYYRLLIWYVFLWRVSRLPLRLNPLHPDRAGGLGFIGIGLRAFAPVLVAHTILVSGTIAARILHEGMKLPAFQTEMAGAVLLVLLVALAPLCFFIVPLVHARLEGWCAYSALAMRYADEFEAKWIRGEHPPDEALVGSGDIQSLADLGNAHDILGEMRMLPIGRQEVVGLAIVLALPFLPLTLTMFPVDELIGRVLGKLL